MNEKTGKGAFPILDGTALKLIAVVSMALDHLGDNFFPGQTWMRVIGRMAMPIFAFCVAEGFIHTRDRREAAGVFPPEHHGDLLLGDPRSYVL